MDGNSNARILSSFGINMMAAVDSLQLPALSLDEPTELLAAYSFQTAISITLSFSDIEIS